MYEFKILVRTKEGGEMAFIVNVDASTTKEAEDAIRYLVSNSLELVSIVKIDV